MEELVDLFCKTTIGKSSRGEILEEKGATLSSGGFSNRYDRPWWQRDQVDEFIGSRGKYFQNPGQSACRFTKSLYE